MSTWRSGQYSSGFPAFSLFFLVAFLERSPRSWSWAAEAATMPKEPIYPKFLTGGTGKSSLLVFSCFLPWLCSEGEPWSWSSDCDSGAADETPQEAESLWSEELGQ